MQTTKMKYEREMIQDYAYIYLHWLLDNIYKRYTCSNDIHTAATVH